jgi:hypothetical protein
MISPVHYGFSKKAMVADFLLCKTHSSKLSARNKSPFHLPSNCSKEANELQIALHPISLNGQLSTKRLCLRHKRSQIVIQTGTFSWSFPIKTKSFILHTLFLGFQNSGKLVFQFIANIQLKPLCTNKAFLDSTILVFLLLYFDQTPFRTKQSTLLDLIPSASKWWSPNVFSPNFSLNIDFARHR